MTINKLVLRPMTLRQANEFVATHHRHNKPVVGCKFCLAAMFDGELVGVAIIGRPVARGLDNGVTAEVLRLCVLDDAPRNTCSFLYGAARRAWSAMGGQKIVTYTLQLESGASLRGAGWNLAGDLKVRTGWNCNSRKREHQPVYEQAKFRWEAE